MNTARAAAVLLLLAGAAPASPAQPADAALAVFAPLVGAPWVADVDGMQDVGQWSWALGGHAVRHVHVVGDGSYAGESLIWHDADRGVFPFRYVTTGGFSTRGTFYAAPDGSLTSEEIVEGGADGMAAGVEAVRSSAALQPDGALVVTIVFKRDGAWGEPDTRTYRRAPHATLPCPYAPACAP